MKVADFLIQVRRRINDTKKIEFTDDELIGYLNKAQDFIVDFAVNHDFAGFIKFVELSLENGSAQLPDGFIRVFKVVCGNKELKPVPIGQTPIGSGYFILGNEIYADCDKVGLYYFSDVPSYSSIDDTILLPRPFLNALQEIVVFLALNRLEYNTAVEQQLAVAFEKELLGIITDYGLSEIPLNLPFRV